MPLFGFDDQFTLFGSTPLENQFILEYLPTAKGDYVKVYLYGLLQCYHPAQDTSPAAMAHELNLAEEEVMAAYRYWERRGLVRRVGDNPPQWRYISVKQRQLMGAETVDEEYVEFCEAVYTIFGADRKLESKELRRAYEWVVDLELPPEVVLMLLNYCKQKKGKHFSFSNVAEKMAMRMKDDNVRTVEEAGEFLVKDEQVENGTRAVLRRLGMKHMPSQDEMDMYIVWTRDWGYSEKAILAACKETLKGTPTFAYLNGILKGMLDRNGQALTSEKQVEEHQNKDAERVKPLKKLLSILGKRDIAINQAILDVYDQMRDIYPDDVIAFAGGECAKSGGMLSDVQEKLNEWKNAGLKDISEIIVYNNDVKEQEELLKKLYKALGIRSNPIARDMQLLHKWRNEFNMSVESIFYCANYAINKNDSIAYLNRIIESSAARGLHTPEQLAAAHAEHQAKQGTQPAQPAKGKVVREQQYEQREYENSPDIPDWMMARWKEMNGDAQ